MIKKLLLAIFAASTLFALPYDEFLLETQLSLLPKIALLEKSQSAARKDIMEILIVYNQDDEEIAKYAVGFLDKKFQGRVGTYRLKVTLSTFDKCCLPGRDTIVYCLNGTEAQLAKVQSYVRQNGFISAIYDSQSLKNGFLFSVILERTPIILMNKKVLKDQQFIFPPNFYTIVRPI